MDHKASYEWRMESMKRIEQIARSIVYDDDYYDNVTDERLYDALLEIFGEVDGIQEEEV